MLQHHISIAPAFFLDSQYPAGDGSRDPDRKPLRSSGARVRVLVVDDEPVIADTVAEILNSNGFDAKGVYGGQDALEIAERFIPDILLTDVLMPKISGIDLAIALRKLHPNTRVLLFSGQAATSGVLDGARNNGYEFEVLPKPIPPDQLIHKLRKG